MKHLKTFENFLNESSSFDDLKKFTDNPYGIGAESVEFVEGDGKNPSRLIFRHENSLGIEKIEKNLKTMGIPANKINKGKQEKGYKYRYELYVFDN